MTTALSALNPLNLFKKPKLPDIPGPLPPPTLADASRDTAPTGGGYSSLISSGGAGGLSRKAQTRKRSLIGGG